MLYSVKKTKPRKALIIGGPIDFHRELPSLDPSLLRILISQSGARYEVRERQLSQDSVLLWMGVSTERARPVVAGPGHTLPGRLPGVMEQT